jgi:hypothetical protein
MNINRGGVPLFLLMKKLTLPINILLFSALLIGSCRVDEPMATPSVANTDYSIIDGDIVKTVVFKDHKKLKDKDPNGKNYIVVGDTILLYKEPKLHTPPTKDPDLSKLKNNDDPDLKGKPLRYVAIGGSLTAGVRDGGYFNEGILTSYPNLIARQMKLKKFEQPLFDATDYNGFGRKVRTSFNPTGGPVPKFNEVKNNSGVESVDEKGVKFKSLKSNNLESLSFPFAQREFIGSYAENNKVNTSFYIKYIDRVFDDKKTSFYSFYKDSDLDFYTLEVGYDNAIEYLLQGRNTDIFGNSFILSNVFNNSFSMGDSPELRLVRYLSGENPKKSKAKGFISNIPNVLELPFFKLLSTTKIIEQFGANKIYYFQEDNSKNTSNFSNEDLLIPNSTTDSLLSTKVHPALKVGLYKPLPASCVFTKYEFGQLQIYLTSMNQQFQDFNKRFGVTVVDLRGLYKKILIGEYTTHDGIKADPTWPNGGNFFSSDGINPTPFGQAIIANEFIQTINTTLKTEIPLIPTREYLNLK